MGAIERKERGGEEKERRPLREIGGFEMNWDKWWKIGNGPISLKIARAPASFSSATCAYTLFYLNRFDALQRPARREYSAARTGTGYHT